jgi:hypothetical protein
MDAKKRARTSVPSKSPTPKKHVVYHADGSVWAKGFKVGDTLTGYWEWFRKDGTKLRSGFFIEGEQTGKWTTYDKKGQVYKVTEMNRGRKKRTAEGKRADER